MDVSELSNQELREQLQELGENPGPITCDLTRTVYERKLLRLLGQEYEEQHDQHYAKTHDTDDSDPEEEEEEEPVVPRHRQEVLRSRARPRSAVQQRAAQPKAKEAGGGVAGAVWSCLAVILALALVIGAAVFSLVFLGPKEDNSPSVEADGTHR